KQRSDSAMKRVTRTVAFFISIGAVSSVVYAVVRIVVAPSDVVPISAADSSAREIEVDRDFGVVRPNVQLADVLTVKNNSRCNWTIGRVTVSCTCTSADPANERVAPGEILSLAVRMKPGAESADVRQNVLVECKEPEAPSLRFNL